ncbi:hypothetical protein [Pseudomonas sp. KCJK9016]|uniref:hypothetical protein n=1 Tax=Pseudomonas sp. KCJK9016 TaxID=3344556 RepID=UPI003905E2D5
MSTRYAIPHNAITPSKGNMTATVGSVPALTFTSGGINFAGDYYTTDRQMRLTLSALQQLPLSIHGIEITFLRDLQDGKHKVEDGKVSAAYWQLVTENGETVFVVNDADSGFINFAKNDALETFSGTFSFTTKNADGTVFEIKNGRFDVEGFDEFTL